MKSAEVLATSADWTRGYRCAWKGQTNPIMPLKRERKEMFLRGYEIGKEDRRGESKQAQG